MKKKKKAIPSIKAYSAPVISIKGERLLERTEILPPTVWEEFEDALTEGLISTQGQISIVLEAMKKHFEIKKLKK